MTLGLLARNPGFARLWLAQVVSQAGDWLNRVAVLTLIGALGAPGLAATAGLGALFGVELALRLLPTSLMGPLAGPVADRLPRRALMIGADVARAAIVLGFLLVREPGDLTLLYALLFSQTCLGIFFESARTAALPSTVAERDLHAAFALSAATWSAMLTIGALAGGVLIQWTGVRGVFIIDALSYLVSAVLIAKLKLPPPPRHAQRLRLSDVLLLTDLRRGLRHVRERGMLPYVLTKTYWGPAGAFLVVLAIAGRERFGDGSPAPDAAGPAAAAAGFATGLLYAARGLGTGLGPYLARRFLGSDDAALRRTILVGFVVAPVFYLPLAWCHSLYLAALLVTAAHLGGGALWVASNTIWQRHVDDSFRGRVYALEFLGMTLSFALNGLFAGWLYDATGSLTLMIGTTAALLAALGAGWWWRSGRAAPG